MKILLIPNAILIPEDMQKKFGKVTPAMVPLGNSSMLENIYRQYASYVDKTYIVVHEQNNIIEKFIKQKGLPIKLIKLEKLDDLGHTISESINIISEENLNIEKLYINFADSLLEKLDNRYSDIVYSAKTESSNLWTYFEDKNGSIMSILDKKILIEKPDEALKYEKIFVGVFCLSHPIEYLNAIKHQKEINQTNIDSFYSGLQEYSHKYKLHFDEVATWFDVGHSESYFKAKSGVAAREFNSIIIDDRRGILRKESENKEKLINEIKWYLKLPDNIKYLAPRIYNYSLNYDNPFVQMEFYGYHTLHESYLYGELSMLRWREIFKKLLFIINDMEQYKVQPSKKVVCNALYNIYVEKTIRRLEQLKTNKEFRNLFIENVYINNKKYKSLNYYISILPKLVSDIIIKKSNGVFNIIHGDLCFANILIEDNYNFMRIIDPRGSFGEFDIYGDPYYELAKLMHSLEGHYDYIIEDLFKVSKFGNKINYTIFTKNNNIKDMFCAVFSDKLKELLPIRLIEATLFLSMVPLHSDYPTRQYVMLSTGIELLETVMKDMEVNENE